MKKIRKYDLNTRVGTGKEVRSDMPGGAEVLCVMTEDGDPKIWALVDSDERIEDTTRTFVVFTRGSEINDMNGYVYVGSYKDKCGEWIAYRQEAKEVTFHVFELVHRHTEEGT